MKPCFSVALPSESNRRIQESNYEVKQGIVPPATGVENGKVETRNKDQMSQ